MKTLTFCVWITVSSSVGVTNSQVCRTPDVPIGGWYEPKQTKYQLGDDITYECKEGYALSGQERRNCISEGWSASPPFCDSPSKIKNPEASNGSKGSERVLTDGNTTTCYNLPIRTQNYVRVYLHNPAVVDSVRLFLPKGTIHIQVLLNSNSQPTQCNIFERTIEIDQWVMVKCLPNRTAFRTHNLDAESVEIRAKLQPSSMLCLCEIQVYTKDDYWCENPPKFNISNGYFEFSRTRAVLHCKEGYKSEYTRFGCEKNTWKGGYGVCKEILCTSDVGNKPMSSGDWIFVGTVSKFSFGTERKLKCDSDFKLEGGPGKVTCLKNGSWSYTNAWCKTKGEKKTRTIVAAVGVVLAVIILSLLGVMIYLIQKKRAKEVVVVFKPGNNASITTASDLEYAAPGYYETVPTPPVLSVQTPPVLPSSPRPAINPPVKLNEVEYLIPQDCLPQPKIYHQASTLPADIAFGTLKESVLYHS